MSSTDPMDKLVSSLLRGIARMSSDSGKLEVITSAIPTGAGSANRRPQFFKGVGEAIAKISEKTQDKAVVKALTAVVLDQDYSDAVKDSKNEVGFFLVEAMRLTNFTFHDPDYLQAFKKKFEGLGIPWKGEPDACIKLATFSGLAYLETDGGYVYCAV